MRTILAGAVAFLTVGCGFLSMAGPARLAAPATRAARLTLPSASPIEFQRELAAEALADVRAIGSGFLLDLVAEEANEIFYAGRGCGELVFVEAQSGEPRWSRKRKGRCDDSVVVRENTLVTFETLITGGKGKTTISELASETGAVIRTVQAGDVLAYASGSDLYLLESDGLERNVIAYGAGLERKWSVPVADANPSGIVLAGNTVYAYGRAVIAIDAASGKASKAVELGRPPHVVTVIPHASGLLLTRTAQDGSPQVLAVGPDGSPSWRYEGGVGLGIGQDGVLVTGKEEIAFLALADGALRWKVKVSGGVAGRPAFLPGPEPLVAVPQGSALAAFAVASGELRWTVPALVGERPVRHTDQVIVAQDVLIWDTWRHVVGIDPSGGVKYSLAVRSLADPHREARAIAASLVPTYNSQTFDVFGGVAALVNQPMVAGEGSSSFAGAGLSTGMTAFTAQTTVATTQYQIARMQANYDSMMRILAERRLAAFQMTQRYAEMSALSDYVIRPIVWNIGRGVLLVRKSDGAFAEVVTGPSDVFEDVFREPSMAGFHTGSNVLLTFSEGFATERWRSVERVPVEIVKRSLVGYAIDPAAFKPAASYASDSKVPAGSFLWRSDFEK